MRYLIILALCCAPVYAEVVSESASGAISGAESQAGAIGMIDNSSFASTTEADNLHDLAPGVFAAGVTAGGSNPCIVSVGGGLSIGGGGFNVANAYNDSECQIREALRLMTAISAQPTQQDGALNNQVLLREIACQSIVYWDAMERTYFQTMDDRYYCSNPRPEDPGVRIASRRAIPTQAISEVKPIKKTSNLSNNGFFATN